MLQYELYLFFPFAADFEAGLEILLAVHSARTSQGAQRVSVRYEAMYRASQFVSEWQEVGLNI